MKKKIQKFYKKEHYHFLNQCIWTQVHRNEQWYLFFRESLLHFSAFFPGDSLFNYLILKRILWLPIFLSHNSWPMKFLFSGYIYKHYSGRVCNVEKFQQCVDFLPHTTEGFRKESFNIKVIWYDLVYFKVDDLRG